VLNTQSTHKKNQQVQILKTIYKQYVYTLKELKDTKVVIIIRKSKDRQQNGQNEKAQTFILI